MDEPRSEPIDQGKTPKYKDGGRRIHDVEAAQSITYKVKRADGVMVEVPGTMYSRANMTYLGHTSELFETPWKYEDRWVGNDPMFRRIPSQWSRFTRLTPDERRKYNIEMMRLAEIENPGRCCERRRWTDGWCRNLPIKGTLWCRWHGGYRQADRSSEVDDAVRAAKVLRRIQTEGI